MAYSRTITKHGAIAGKTQENTTCKESLQVQQEGNRLVERN